MSAKNMVLLVTLALIVMATVFSPKNNQVLAFESPQVRSAEEAYRKDAEAYAAAFNVSIDEAVRRLKLQDAISLLDAALQVNESAIFGGFWIEHTPTFRVIIQLTYGSEKDILKYITLPEIADIIEVVSVSNTYVSLKEQHADIISLADMIKVPFESGIVFQKNQIEIYVTNRLAFEVEMARKKQKISPNIAIIEVPALASEQRNWYGGNALNNCTTGLSIINSSGSKYSSSAGHCNSSHVSPLTLFQTYYGGAYDFSVLTVPSGDVIKNWVADNYTGDSTPLYREINGYVINASVGSFMCKNGKTTGYTCGTIEQNNYNYMSSATWYLVKSSSTTSKISCGGDSGAAWFAGNSAYGNHSSGWCDLNNNKAIVMPVLMLTNKGYYPMTSP